MTASGVACRALPLPHQLRQLGKVHRDPPRLVAGEQLGRRSPAELFLEIDIGDRPTGSLCETNGSFKARCCSRWLTWTSRANGRAPRSQEDPAASEQSSYRAG